MAWCQTCAKPLPEPMTTEIIDAYMRNPASMCQLDMRSSCHDINLAVCSATSDDKVYSIMTWFEETLPSYNIKVNFLLITHSVSFPRMTCNVCSLFCEYWGVCEYLCVCEYWCVSTTVLVSTAVLVREYW